MIGSRKSTKNIFDPDLQTREILSALRKERLITISLNLLDFLKQKRSDFLRKEVLTKNLLIKIRKKIVKEKNMETIRFIQIHNLIILI
jgi:hypothetical protein